MNDDKKYSITYCPEYFSYRLIRSSYVKEKDETRIDIDVLCDNYEDFVNIFNEFKTLWGKFKK